MLDYTTLASLRSPLTTPSPSTVKYVAEPHTTLNKTPYRFIVTDPGGKELGENQVFDFPGTKPSIDNTTYYKLIPNTSTSARRLIVRRSTSLPISMEPSCCMIFYCLSTFGRPRLCADSWRSSKSIIVS